MNNRSKTVLTTLIAILPFGPRPAEAAGPPISISIKAAQETVKSGDSVIVKVTIKNVSEGTITEFARAFSSYIVLATDANGKAVKEAEKPKNSVLTEKQVYMYLDPQQKFEEDLPISGEVDMMAPGKYLVRVLRRIPKDQGGGVVASNVITLTVEDAPK